jgi:hypothetical protein
MRVVLRIRTGPEKRVHLKRRPNQRLAALAAPAVLAFALVCFLMCAWRWSFELSWTGRYPIAAGAFSHWQSWFVAGMLWQVLGVRLWRYGGGERGASLARELPVRQPQIP